MAAYIVAQLDVKNTNWQKEYGPKAGALVQNTVAKFWPGLDTLWSASKGIVHCPASCLFWSSRLWSRQKRGTTIPSMLT
jgi:hypothetical protein